MEKAKNITTINICTSITFILLILFTNYKFNSFDYAITIVSTVLLFIASVMFNSKDMDISSHNVIYPVSYKKLNFIRQYYIQIIICTFFILQTGSYISSKVTILYIVINFLGIALINMLICQKLLKYTNSSRLHYNFKNTYIANCAILLILMFYNIRYKIVLSIGTNKSFYSMFPLENKFRILLFVVDIIYVICLCQNIFKYLFLTEADILIPTKLSNNNLSNDNNKDNDNSDINDSKIDKADKTRTDGLPVFNWYSQLPTHVCCLIIIIIAEFTL